MSEGIYKRGKKPNHWTIKISLGLDPDTGKYREKWVSFTGTKKEAEQERTRLLRERDTGVLVADPSKWTLAEYMTHWLGTYVAQNCRPKTQAGYRDLVERLMLPFIGTVPLAKLSGAHLRDLYGKLLKGERESGRPLSARTVHHVHRILKEALSHAVKWQMVARNVADGVDAPRPEQKEMVVWDAEEARRFLAAVVTPDGEESVSYGAALAVALETGVRQAELLGLRWKDVDLQQGTAQISQTIQRVHKMGLVTGQPKTARGRRRIALTPSSVALLRAHKVRQNETRLLLGPAWQDGDLVFSTPLGTAVDPRNLHRLFVKACDKAGVRRIPFHSLRHTHATMLLLRNVPAKVVSERLGHANIGITMDCYSHVLPQMQDMAVRELEVLLRGAH